MIKHEYNVEECIRGNLTDNESRFLMTIITNPNLGIYLIEKILKTIDKPYVYFIGSQLENDLYDEAYAAKVISKIQIYMSQPIVLF